MVGFIIVCLRFIIPQLYDSIRELSLMIPDIYKSIVSIFEHYRENSTDMFPGQIADMIETKTLPKLFELTNNLLTNIVPMLYEASMSFAKGLFNLFIAFIVSIYMTIDKFILKNAGKRLVLAIFNENFSYRVLRTLKDCHNIFSGFIIGKSIDSLIIGLLGFCCDDYFKTSLYRIDQCYYRCHKYDFLILDRSLVQFPVLLFFYRKPDKVPDLYYHWFLSC